jgi:hypothetical protein
MVSVKAGLPEATELGLRLRSVGAAANAACAQAKARITEVITVNHRRNGRALSI